MVEAKTGALGTRESSIRGVLDMSGGLLGIGAVTSIGFGAILVFAVDWQWEGANRPLIGLIMIAVGMIALSAFLSVQRNRGEHHDGHDHSDRYDHHLGD
ncbi:hypothetical protein [Streptomyces sp. T028]|uniref:hypothetical protein n=1 Tax=Streptomyces sp. T028 TaxID=3394379 RepID=UPI003A877461